MNKNQKEVFKNAIAVKGKRVGEIADSIGLTRQSISALVNGKKSITADRFADYCAVLNTEECRLLGAFLSDKAASLKRKASVNKKFTVTLEEFSNDGKRKFIYKRDV